MGKLTEKLTEKKTIENMGVLLILIVILVMALNSIYSEDENEIQNESNIHIDLEHESKTEFELRLENILSKISGVGEATVMVSYENDVQKIPLIDTKSVTTVTSEKDSSGGERKTEETNIENVTVFEEKNGVTSPAIKEYTIPKILGVIVVADGGSNIEIKENIISAVESVTGVAAHKIQVYGK